MKFNKLNDWLRVIADLGILVGILLVLVQMNQNEDLMRSQIMNQYYDSYSSYEASFAGENLPAIWEKSLLDPENLTLAEMRALEAVTFARYSVGLTFIAKARPEFWGIWTGRKK